MLDIKDQVCVQVVDDVMATPYIGFLIRSAVI